MPTLRCYTVVLGQSKNSYVVCLEIGIVGQGNNQEDVIESLQNIFETETNIYNSPISIEALHEFLMVSGKVKNTKVVEFPRKIP